MKLALTILCGLLLAIMPAMSRSPSPACTTSAHVQYQCCGCGGKMPCCANRSASHSHPAPVTATNAGAQNQNPVPVPSILGWQPPADELFLLPPAFSSVAMADATPLYTRDCALLI